MNLNEVFETMMLTHERNADAHSAHFQALGQALAGADSVFTEAARSQAVVEELALMNLASISLSSVKSARLSAVTLETPGGVLAPTAAGVPGIAYRGINRGLVAEAPTQNLAQDLPYWSLQSVDWSAPGVISPNGQVTNSRLDAVGSVSPVRANSNHITGLLASDAPVLRIFAKKGSSYLSLQADCLNLAQALINSYQVQFQWVNGQPIALSASGSGTWKASRWGAGWFVFEIRPTWTVAGSLIMKVYPCRAALPSVGDHLYLWAPQIHAKEPGPSHVVPSNTTVSRDGSRNYLAANHRWLDGGFTALILLEDALRGNCRMLYGPSIDLLGFDDGGLFRVGNALQSVWLAGRRYVIRWNSANRTLSVWVDGQHMGDNTATADWVPSVGETWHVGWDGAVTTSYVNTYLNQFQIWAWPFSDAEIARIVGAQ